MPTSLGHILINTRCDPLSRASHFMLHRHIHYTDTELCKPQNMLSSWLAMLRLPSTCDIYAVTPNWFPWRAKPTYRPRTEMWPLSAPLKEITCTEYICDCDGKLWVNISRNRSLDIDEIT